MATVAVVSFTDPRRTAMLEEREAYNKECHRWLISELTSRGFEVIDGNADFSNREFFGVATLEDVKMIIPKIRDAEAIVAGCWHWTDMMAIISLVRDLAKPIALFTRDNPAWAGVTCVSSAGASLWESSANEYMTTHERFIDDVEELAKWLRGVSALERLKRSTLILFGGSYCLHMEHLRDDLPFLKTFLVGEIDEESEYLIIKNAEKIDPRRVDAFLEWFRENGGIIKYGGILDEASLRKQVALYLATKDIVNKYNDVVGISIRCQPELSEVYGVTGCLIPAFMPYHEDSEGRKRVIPTVCEGDVKGLITSALLYLITGEPPLFGDLKYVDDGLIVIANCGASSVYHACHSYNVKECLSKVSFQSQCQGSAGAAVTYRTPPSVMTVCRLARIGGRYVMQIALGNARKVSETDEKSLKWGATWPHTFIEILATKDEIISTVASNHFVAVTGDVTAEVEYACNLAGIDVEWIGSPPIEMEEMET